MAQCFQCKTETSLYDNGVPICPKCDDARSEPAQRTESENALNSRGNERKLLAMSHVG
jgi:uncharacterized Zn ribbon protein